MEFCPGWRQSDRNLRFAWHLPVYRSTVRIPPELKLRRKVDYFKDSADSILSRPPENSRSANRLTASGVPSFLFVSTQLRKRITELLQRTRIRNYISSSMANKEPMEDPGRQQSIGVHLVPRQAFARD